MLTFKKLREANNERSVEWCGGVPVLKDLEFTAIELAGECGEALNIVKKLVRHIEGHKGGVSISKSKKLLADELADIIICADRLAEVLKIDLGISVVDKFNKTSDKHGFDTVLSA